eukprot:1158642-Pleurochrysis_carterae.AAC.1
MYFQFRLVARKKGAIVDVLRGKGQHARASKAEYRQRAADGPLRDAHAQHLSSEQLRGLRRAAGIEN